MVTGLALVPATRPVERSWEEMLLGAVRPEFQVAVYRPAPSDPILYGPTCAVGGCPGRGVNRSLGLNAGGANRSVGTRFRGYVCLPHVEMWRRDGEPPINVWVRQSAQALKSQGIAVPCSVPGCRRSRASQGLCAGHWKRWLTAGQPALAAFLPVAGLMRTREEHCAMAGCDFPAAGQMVFCDGHGWRFRNARAARPGLTAEGYIAYLTEARRVTAPSYDMSALPAMVRLEMGLALQCRQEAQRSQMQPLTFGQVVRWVLDEGVESILERGEAHWVDSARRRFAHRKVRSNPLAWWRFVRQCALRLQARESGEQVWRWDTWPTDQLDVDARWAHQPVRRIYFSEIDPLWLRELVKRWARWRLTSATKSPASISCSTSSIRRFCRWTEASGIVLAGPAAITRDLLERYRADVFLLDRSPGRKSGLLTDLKVFLDDVRLHDWVTGLAANATYYRGEIPRDRSWLPRFIDEFVIAQLETDAALDRLPDLTTRTAVGILIETGLRSVDCLRLPFDPITVDQVRRAVPEVLKPQAVARGDHPDLPAADRADLLPATGPHRAVRDRAAATAPARAREPRRDRGVQLRDAQPAPGRVAREMRGAGRDRPAGQGHRTPVPAHGRDADDQQRGADRHRAADARPRDAADDPALRHDQGPDPAA